VTVASVVALAAPAAVWADGAGDQQYENPLPAPSAPKKPKPAATQAPAAAAPVTSTSPAAAPAPAAAELPRTGIPAGVVALGGMLMAGAGLALRRRLAAS
jgi:LPXTG-motif cell wall-anchored protein